MQIIQHYFEITIALTAPARITLYKNTLVDVPVMK
jgi:hypothetical protein